MEHTETIKKNYEFRRLYAKGKSAVTPTLVVYTRRIKTDGNRVGFTVTTRLGHAVTRNRVRRRLREIYRLHEAELRRGAELVVSRARAASPLPTASWSGIFSVPAASSHCCRRILPCESHSSLAHPFLPEKYLSPKASLLPVYPDMLPVRAGSHREIRRCQGRLARIQAHLPVPSVPYRRTRFL